MDYFSEALTDFKLNTTFHGNVFTVTAMFWLQKTITTQLQVNSDTMFSRYSFCQTNFKLPIFKLKI